MKKALCLIFVLTFLLVGCNNQKVKSSDTIRKELLNVIENKTSFLDANNQEVLLKDYQIPECVDYVFSPLEYALVDFDGDKTEELVILDARKNFYQILRYDKSTNKFYGYTMNIRSLIDLKTDGTFMQSSGAGINSISKLNFENGEIVFTELALKNDYDKEYKINQKNAKPEDVKSFFDEWTALPTVSWTGIN